MNEAKQILVTSHVARDFLQSAAVFNTLPKVVWEYVSNSLDNPRENKHVSVVVEISDSEIEIIDDGGGMSRNELSDFFQMHGVNIKRSRGKRVRGRFGTGKSAAFGIANILTVDTVQEQKRNVVIISREEINSAKEGEPFPVQDLIMNKETTLDNGTTITIEEIKIKTKDKIPSVVSYVERHIGRYRQKASVTINGHVCKYKEPNVSIIHEKTPPASIKQIIGDVRLIIKVSPTPLGDEDRGIDILSDGIWHETTLAGLVKKEFSKFLFGEVDVPLFEQQEDWDIPPFDNTRNNQLNRANPLVVTLLGWIAQELEVVRLILVEEDKKRRESIEAKKLEKEAKEIAKILNEDFNQVIDDFELAAKISARRGKTRISADPSSIFASLPGEGDEDTGFQKAGQEHGEGTRGENPPGPGDQPRNGPSVIDGDQKGKTQPASRKGKRRRRGIFSIEYLKETSKSHRSRYDSEIRTIIINLDHPQISAVYNANNKNVTARNFREISYEIAVVEYALALPYERMKIDDLYDAAEALFDTREIINRVTRRFAEILYNKS